MAAAVDARALALSLKRLRQERFLGWCSHELNLPALRCREPPHAPDMKRLGAQTKARELADEEIEADAMAADDDDVRRFEIPPKELDGDRAARIENLIMLVDGDEAIRAAERGYGARAFAQDQNTVSIQLQMKIEVPTKPSLKQVWPGMTLQSNKLV